MCRIYHKLQKLDSKKTSNPIKNDQQTWIEISGKNTNNLQISEKWSPSLTVRELYAKPTMRSHLTLVRLCYGKDMWLQVLGGMRRGTSGSFHCQLDTAWDHLGRERVSIKNGLDQRACRGSFILINGREKTAHCGQSYHSLGLGPGLSEGRNSKLSGKLIYTPLCLLQTDVMWPAVSGSCRCGFPALMDCNLEQHTKFFLH